MSFTIGIKNHVSDGTLMLLEYLVIAKSVLLLHETVRFQWSAFCTGLLFFFLLIAHSLIFLYNVNNVFVVRPTDVNECIQRPCGSEACTNTYGSYFCGSPRGRCRLLYPMSEHTR